MKTYELSGMGIKERHGLLLGAVGPRPIAWVSTIDDQGRPNLAPFSFFNVFSSNPPILVFSPARSGRTNKTKHTLDNVKLIPEAVVHVTSYKLLDKMVMTSLEFEKGVSEFSKAGLRSIPSESVRPPRIAEAPVQMECKVLEVKELGKEGAAGNLVICEVTRMHLDEKILNEQGHIDPNKIDLVGRMGGAWYTRASGNALFQIQTDFTKLVVGYDMIPAFVRDTELLTAADLGRMATHPSLPDETAVNDFKLEELDEEFYTLQDKPSELELALIHKAKLFLEQGNIEKAWMCVLAYND